MFAIIAGALVFSSLVVATATIILVMERERLRFHAEDKLRERTGLLHAAAFALREQLTSVCAIEQREQTSGERSPMSRSATQAMHAAVVDLLEVFDITTGGLTIDRQKIDLGDEVNVLLTRMNGRFERQGRSAIVTAGYMPQVSIETDPVRVRQCLSTLIDYAAQESKDGRVQVSYRVESKPGDGARVTFVIKTNSAAASVDFAEAVFQATRFPEHPLLRQNPSQMLALSLAREIAEAMGGTVSGHAQPDGGATFFFSFKGIISAPSAHPSDQLAEDRDTPEEKTFEHFSVLLVDDNRLNLFVLEEIMMPLRFGRVVSVTGGQQAIEWARKEQFDLIFLDLTMPTLNGYDVARAIRAKGRSADAPIIAVSADHRAGVSSALSEAGISGFIPKPLRPERVLTEIERVFPEPSDAEATAPQRRALG